MWRGVNGFQGTIPPLKGFAQNLLEECWQNFHPILWLKIVVHVKACSHSEQLTSIIIPQCQKQQFALLV